MNGPNGSGKTTLLRMIALNIILAQIGCYVTCEKFKLTPFHFVFNKAAGDIAVHHETSSSFEMELTETGNILR